ncbi:bifunctional ornithine acetyltransferase/N-acetylglutamate synthase, partial [Thermodesulfobacteriota bacterium]
APLFSQPQQAMPSLVASMSRDGFDEFAEAIMTTDTVPKIVTRRTEVAEGPFTVLGVAKGAGMMRPDMATMLVFVCTDLAARPDTLEDVIQNLLENVGERLDGDTSTNDTVLLLANGMAGVAVESFPHVFQEVLDDVLLDLAKELVRDGEGATKMVTVLVKGARAPDEARRVADTVSHSSLVKTALFGEDANWGRVIAAVGRAGVPIRPEKIDIFFDEVRLVQDGEWCGAEAEASSTEVLKRPEFVLCVDLKSGSDWAQIYTCDLSVEYVRINADYRS